MNAAPGAGKPATMRLVFLSPLPPDRAGLAEEAAHVRRAFNGAGIDVLTPLQGQRPLQTLPAARRWVAERDWSKVDIVHAELGQGRHSEFFALCALSELPRRPALSVTVHDPDRLVWVPLSTWWRHLAGTGFCPRWALRVLASMLHPHTLWAERRLARRLEGLVVHTEEAAQAVHRRLAVPRHKVSVIPRGVVPLPVAPVPPLTPLRLLCLGSASPRRAVEQLIDAVASVRSPAADQAPALCLTIAAGHAAPLAHTHPPRDLAPLRRRVTERQLDDLVDWALDLDERDMPSLLERHHVLVLPESAPSPGRCRPARAHGQSALTWAWACGRAVLRSGPSPADVRERAATLPCDAADQSSLARQLTELLARPEGVQEGARAAEALAASRAWPLIGQQFRQHFDKLLGQRAR